MAHASPNNTTRPTPEPPIDDAVRVENLHVARGGQAILNDVSCRIARGSLTTILGPNGCGKTSLTRVLTGHMFITSGSVCVLGEQLGATDIRGLRERIALVNPTVDTASAHVSGAVVDGDLTAREAVLTGFFGTVGLYDPPSDRQVERAEQLLSAVGLSRRRDLRFIQLSTGQQRRCLIARSLVRQPELLILDEPTAGLDLAAREQVLATIHALSKQNTGPTVLMITHHVEEIPPHTDQVMLMKEGRITAMGPANQVITPESLTQTFGCKVFVRKIHGRFWIEVLPEAWLELSRDQDHAGPDGSAAAHRY